MSDEKQKERTVVIKCEAAGVLPIEELSGFQGDLKTLSEANKKKLRKSIEKYGFTAPIFIWKSGKKNYILDGHQRITVLSEMKGAGYDIPPLPVAYIHAKTKKEAKEKLLHITSQYGEFSRDGFMSFSSDIKGNSIETLRLANMEFKLSSPKRDVEIKEKIELIIECRDENEAEKLYEEFLNREMICRLSTL